MERVRYSRRPGRKGKWQVYLYWKKRKYVRYFYEDGLPLASEKECQRVCALIGMDLEKRGDSFDPGKWFGSDRHMSKTGFAAYVMEWFSRKESEYAPSWRVGAKRYVGMFAEHFGNTELSEIRAKDIRDFYYDLPKEFSPKTKKHIMGFLHKVFADAFAVEDIDRIPVFPRIPVSETETRYLDPATQQKVLAAIPDQHRPIFEFLAEFGCRPSEARALLWDAVDFERGTITIKRAYSLDTLREVTKTRLIRILPMTARARAILEAICPVGDHVFVKDGGFYRRMDLPRIWQRAARSVGTDVACYQGTRHTRATHLLNSGVPREVVQRLLGHQRADQTDRYARILTGTVKGALEMVPLPYEQVPKSEETGATVH